MTDEHIQMYIEEFLSDNNLQDTDKLTMQDLIALARRFINVVEANGHSFIGIDGWLQWIYGCLLQSWHNLPKHPDSPELTAASKRIEDFRAFAKSFLHFDYSEGTFTDSSAQAKDPENENK